MTRRIGRVYLVGSGPGDPGLMTLRGQRALGRADVVLYDHLAHVGLLSEVKEGTSCLYAGKEGGTHSLEQREINRLLIRQARRGKVIVRLKGGDPFLFGRGGEEAEALAKARIPFEVIPGVTSATAVPAYAGIPITHRRFNTAVAVVTGHERENGGPATNWSSLAQVGTLVFLMGIGNLKTIIERLTRAGLESRTPVAVIEWGTLSNQRVVTGTLRDIGEKVRRLGIRPPAVTVIGKVVNLRKRLQWFEKRPLFGRRILVTRSREQAGEISTLLSDLGAEAIEIPTIEVRPPTSFQPLDRALERLRNYDWLIFTSVNGVAVFFERLLKKGKDLRDLKGLKVAAIGPATARAIEEKGIRVDSVAHEYRAEGLVRVLSKGIRGKRVLIPRARQAREILVEELRRRGSKVDVVEAYRTSPPKGGAAQLKRVIERGGVDLITFASSSTVENFVRMIGPSLLRKVRKIPVATIGPVTAATAKRRGLKVRVQPREYTIPSLVSAIVNYFH